MSNEERQEIINAVYDYVSTYTVNITDRQRKLLLDKLEVATDNQLIGCKEILKDSKNDVESYTYFFNGKESI